VAKKADLARKMDQNKTAIRRGRTPYAKALITTAFWRTTNERATQILHFVQDDASEAQTPR